MAKYSEQFLAGLLAPNPMTQGMMSLGKAVGDTARNYKIRQDTAGFNVNTVQGLQGLAQYYHNRGDSANAAKYVAAARQLAASEASTKMSKAQLAELERQNEERTSRETYFKTLGKEYFDLHAMGMNPAQILQRYDQDQANTAKVAFGSALGYDSSTLENMSMREIQKALDDKKEEGAGEDLAKFLGAAKGQITADNYDEAIDLAIKANGSAGLSQINMIYGQTLERALKAKEAKIVKAEVILNDSSILAGSIGSAPKSKTINLAVDDKGNLTAESEAYLSNVATSAFIPVINKHWSPKPSTSTTPPTPKNPSNPTLNTMLRR
jgi:hypothetical protein